MAYREWTIAGHTIAVEHGWWNGEARILVDGVPIVYRASPPLWQDFGFVRCFDLDGTRYAVRVMPNWYCLFQLDLFVGPEAERMRDANRSPLWQSCMGILLTMAVVAIVLGCLGWIVLGQVVGQSLL